MQQFNQKKIYVFFEWFSKKIIIHIKDFIQRNYNSIKNFDFFEIFDSSNVNIDE